MRLLLREKGGFERGKKFSVAIFPQGCHKLNLILEFGSQIERRECSERVTVQY